MLIQLLILVLTFSILALLAWLLFMAGDMFFSELYMVVRYGQDYINFREDYRARNR